MRYLIAVGILSVGLLLGTWLGFHLGPASTPAAVTAAPVDRPLQSEPAETAPQKGSMADARTDTAPKLADIGEMASDFDQTIALYRLLAPLDASGVDSLMDEAATVLQGDDYRAATAIMIARLAELDPQRALLRLDGADAVTERGWAHALFHSWARLDLDPALQAAHELQPMLRPIAGRAILRAREDLAFTERQEIAERLGSPLPILESGNFNAAWLAALDEPNLATRWTRLAQVGLQWGMADPLAALQALELLPEDASERSAGAQIVQGWAQRDPQAALAWVLENAQESDRVNMLVMTIQQIAQTDLPAALDAVHNLDADSRVGVMPGLLAQWVVTDLPGATAWVLDESTGRERQAYLASIVRGLQGHGDDTLVNWLDSLPRSDAQSLLPESMGALARRDPQQAAAQLTLIDDSDKRTIAAKSLLRVWGRADPEAALIWLETEPEELQEAATVDLVRGWATGHPENALTYVLDLPAGARRDEMLMHLLNVVPPSQYETVVDAISRTDLRASIRRMEVEGQMHRYIRSF